MVNFKREALVYFAVLSNNESFNLVPLFKLLFLNDKIFQKIS